MRALEIAGLSKSFGGLRVTANVNLSVAPGERRLIIGPNGAGLPSPRPFRHGAHLSNHHAVPA